MSDSRLGTHFYTLGSLSALQVHDHRFLSPRLAHSLKILALMQKTKITRTECKKDLARFWVYFFAFCPGNVQEDSEGRCRDKLVAFGLRVASPAGAQNRNYYLGEIQGSCFYFFSGLQGDIQLETLNNWHHPNHGSYLLGLDHFRQPQTCCATPFL